MFLCYNRIMEKVIYIRNRQNVKMAVKLNVSPERKKCAFLEHGLGARKVVKQKTE